MVAKRGKVGTGEPSSVEDDEGMHMPVGGVVVVDRCHKLDGLAVPLL
jgi:hypothetical protein